MATGREILPLAPHSASSLVRRLSRLPVLAARAACNREPADHAGATRRRGGHRTPPSSQRWSARASWATCGCLTTSRRRWPVPVWASSSRTRCFRR